MEVKDCMCNNIHWCLPSSTVEDCAKIMNEKQVGCVPVCDENKKLVGIVTDRDIALRCIACGKQTNNTKVSDIMTCDICSCTPNDNIKTVENKMSEYKVRRIPIVDDGKVVGLITLGDLARNSKINAEGVGTTLEQVCCNNKCHNEQ